MPFIKNKAQKMNVNNNQIYKNKNPHFKNLDRKAAASPEEINHLNQNFEKKRK